MNLRQKTKELLLWSQKYTQADMFYIARSGYWSILSFTVSSILSLVLVIAFANLLSKESYGIYRYIMSLGGTMGFLTLTGMNTAVVRAVAKGYDGALKYTVKLQLRWNLLFLLAMFLLGAYYFLKNNTLFAASFMILGLASPFSSAFSTYGAYLAGKKDFQRSSKYAIISSLIHISAVLIALLLTKNIIVIIASYVFSSLFSSWLFYSRTLKIYKSENLEKNQQKELLKYGGHLSLANVFATISQFADKVVVFQFLGPGVLAVYAIALSVPERVRGLLKTSSGIMLPKLSEKSIEEINSIFLKRTWQGLLIGLAISLAYILLAPFFFEIFLPQYKDSIFYSQLVALSLIFILPSSYTSSVFKSQKLVKTIYLSSLVGHISRIVLFIVFGAIWGVLGVIAATLSVYAIGLFYNFALWNRVVKNHRLKKLE